MTVRAIGRLRAGGGGLTAVASLFAAGEQGGWWDPSDFSTMFQDSAGTTPVTAVGQPVGLMLDKRLGAVREATKITNGDFSAGATAWTVNTSVAIASGRVDFTGAAASYLLFQDGGAGFYGAGNSYEIEFDYSSNVAIQPLISGNGVATVAAGTGHYRAILASLPSDSNGRFQINANAASATGWIDNITVRRIAGNHRTQATAASRPTLRQDASGYYYLEYDGVDDSMSTGSVDFSATDKMTVWAGVHKQSDATGFGIVAELGDRGAAQAGSFSVCAPGTAGTASYFFALEGTTIASREASTSFAAPISNILSGVFDLSQATAATEISPRVNGVASAFSSTAQAGTGNFGNYPIYFGRRGGSTLPFNGREYCTIIRGAATSDSQIARVERFVAARMGVALA